MLNVRSARSGRSSYYRWPVVVNLSIDISYSSHRTARPFRKSYAQRHDKLRTPSTQLMISDQGKQNQEPKSPYPLSKIFFLPPHRALSTQLTLFTRDRGRPGNLHVLRPPTTYYPTHHTHPIIFLTPIIFITPIMSLHTTTPLQRHQHNHPLPLHQHIQLPRHRHPTVTIASKPYHRRRNHHRGPEVRNLRRRTVSRRGTTTVREATVAPAPLTVPARLSQFGSVRAAVGSSEITVLTSRSKINPPVRHQTWRLPLVAP